MKQTLESPRYFLINSSVLHFGSLSIINTQEKRSVYNTQDVGEHMPCRDVPLHTSE